MTQIGPRSVFEHLGTRNGNTHGLLIMSYDVVGFSNDLKG